MVNVAIFLSIIGTVAAIFLSVFAYKFHKLTESEKLLRQFKKTRTYKLALQTFGSEESVVSWLRTTNLALGKTPLDAAQSPRGCQEVEKILLAINFGSTL